MPTADVADYRLSLLCFALSAYQRHNIGVTKYIKDFRQPIWIAGAWGYKIEW